MARIRTIKPEFWTDGNMVKLSSFARLLYIGMWNFTLCDHGHVADDAMKLKLQILPADNVDVEELLAEIMAQGRITRIASAGGRTYLHIKRFEDHQKIDPRWKTRCPACAHVDSFALRETQVSSGETQRDSPTLPLGREGKGREGIKTSPAPAAESPEFTTFWAAYPRRIGKQDAMEAFVKALRLASLGDILSGLNTLKREVSGKDPMFIPHAATWLNARRWEDEPAPITVITSPWSREFHQTGTNS